MSSRASEREVFGEEFANSTALRRETAICLSSIVHLAVLKRDSFKSCLNEYSDGVVDKKIPFLRRNQLFNDWSDSNLKALFYEVKEVTCKKGELVFAE